MTPLRIPSPTLALRACLLALLLGVPAGAQVATALLVQGERIPGADGATLTVLGQAAVNHVGGYSFNVVGSDAESRIWGNAGGGPGGVLRTEATFGIYEQTMFQSFYGLANAGELAYVAQVIVAGMDPAVNSLWRDDALVALAGDPVPSLPGQFWRFTSRPGVTQEGTPYWVGTLTDTPGGKSQNQGIFLGVDATPVLLGTDLVPGLPFPLDPSSAIGFDYRFSEDGNHYIAEVHMATDPDADNAMVLDGVGLLVGGALAREDDPVPAAAGGLPGERWALFLQMGINEASKWFFRGATDAGPTIGTIIVVDGTIAYRGGDVLDGETLSGSIRAAYMNAQGDLAFEWGVLDGGDTVDALFLNETLLLKQGDPVDLDGDGVVEPDSRFSAFTLTQTLALGDRDDAGSVDIYFRAFVDTQGTPSILDDEQALFRLRAQTAECFLVIGDGPGAEPFLGSSHVFETQLDTVEDAYPVLLDDIPEFVLPLPQITSRAGQVGTVAWGVGPAGGGQMAEVPAWMLDGDFAVQVLMWNPAVFPQQPEQYTAGLYVSIQPNGTVLTTPFGSDLGGMSVWHAIDTNAAGQTVIRFPFAIPGLQPQG